MWLAETGHELILGGGRSSGSRSRSWLSARSNRICLVGRPRESYSRQALLRSHGSYHSSGS